MLEYNGTTGAFEMVFAQGGGLDLPTFLTFGPNAVNAVPEPTSLLLVGTAFGGLLVFGVGRKLAGALKANGLVRSSSPFSARVRLKVVTWLEPRLPV